MAKIEKCPRCGSPGYLETHCTDREGRYCYWRVVHIYKVAGKTRRKVCYLGPVGRDYFYVEKVHKLALTSILQQDISKIVYNAVSKLIDAARSSKTEDKPRILEEIKKVRKIMEQLIIELKEIEKETATTNI